MKIVALWICIVSTQIAYSQSISCLLTSPSNSERLYYKLDNLPEDISVGKPGQNNLWDFSGLRAPVVHTFRYQSAEKGKYFHLFPTADYTLLDAWGSEKYFRSKGSDYQLLAEVIPARNARSQPIIKKYDIPLVLFNWDKLGKKEAYSSGMWSVTLEEYELRDFGIDQINRLKIEVNEDVTETMDASGLIYLPNSIENVSRIKRQKNNEITVSSWTDGEWVPINSSILKKLKIEVHSYIEEYLYVDLKTKDIVALVNMNQFGSPGSVLYKSSDIDNAITYNPDKGQQFILHPSTTFGDIRLDFIGFSSGKYTLELSNIIGKKIWTQVYTVNRDMTLKEDLSFLPKGTYQYTLLDDQHNRILTRRLAIIKP